MFTLQTEPYRVSASPTRPSTLSLLSLLIVFPPRIRVFPPQIRGNIGLWLDPKNSNFRQCLVFRGEGLGRTLTRFVKSPYS
jgi:hypothetical protein